MGAAEDLKENGIIREFQVFIKSTGPKCNLACSYCYYLKNSALFDSKTCRMDDNLLETLVSQQIEATTEPIIRFSWHGGEPLLAGIDFYRKAVALQKKYCPPGKLIINGIQTNGILVNDLWCEFLSSEKFIVGLSLDGPEHLHDIYRKNKNGGGTFRKVMSAYDKLVMHGTDPEILCVVNNANVSFPLDVYRFYRELGISFITFIPLVEKSFQATVKSFSVNPLSFGEFLCTVFDEWLAHDIGRIKVQIFEEALRVAFEQQHTLCIFKPECGGVPVVEHNGNFYSCDHFVDPDHEIGNINGYSLAQMLDNSKQKLFGKTKFSSLPEYCRKCDVLVMCNGECPKNRFLTTPDGESGLNYLCQGYKRFFSHCRPFIETVKRISES